MRCLGDQEGTHQAQEGFQHAAASNTAAAASHTAKGQRWLAWGSTRNSTHPWSWSAYIT